MKKRQWHPVFAQLLRPVVEGHYEVRTDIPVGDAPRKADILLLRRITAMPLPFVGLWRHLTALNVVEFKGPTVSPRPGDLDLLIELGLGIHRRLNEDRGAEGQTILEPGDISFWYLANRLGRRFLRDCEKVAGPLEAQGPGVWRCRAVRRAVFLVSGTELPVEPDSLPLHVIAQEPAETERAVAEFVARRPDLVEQYGGLLAVLHPRTWREVEVMAKTKRGKMEIDLEPLFEMVGMRRVIDTIGVERVIKGIGLDRLINGIGLERVIDAVGIRRVIDEKGIDWLITEMSPQQRRQLKEHLK